jgi:hypothetical protein
MVVRQRSQRKKHNTRKVRKNKVLKGGSPIKVVVHSPKTKKVHSKSKSTSKNTAVAPKRSPKEEFYYDPESNRYAGEINVIVHGKKSKRMYVGGDEMGIQSQLRNKYLPTPPSPPSTQLPSIMSEENEEKQEIQERQKNDIMMPLIPRKPIDLDNSSYQLPSIDDITDKKINNNGDKSTVEHIADNVTSGLVNPIVEHPITQGVVNHPITQSFVNLFDTVKSTIGADDDENKENNQQGGRRRKYRKQKTYKHRKSGKKSNRKYRKQKTYKHK